MFTVRQRLGPTLGATGDIDMMIAEAQRLGLLNARVQRTAGFPHLMADFNGKPISVPLPSLPPVDDRHPAKAVTYLHRQLRRFALMVAR